MISIMTRRNSLGLIAAATLATTLLNSTAAFAQSKGSITVSAVSSFKLIEALVPEFTAETGIAVDLQILPYDQLRQRSTADFVSGTANSDVYAQDIVWLGEWSKNAYARPLDDLIARDITPDDLKDVLPGAFDAVSKQGGKTWSFPVTATYFLMYYRTDLFKQAGLAEPVTFADVNTAAEKLTAKDKNQYGIDMPYKRGESFATWFLAAYAGAGGKILKDAPTDFTPTLDSPVAAQVLKNYIGWLKSAPNGAIGHDRPDQTIAMQTGKIAMAATFSVNGTEFVKPEVSSVAGNVGYTTMPRLEASQKPVYPFGGFGMAINAKTEKVENSWAFIKWLSSAKVQTKLALLNGTPMRYSALRDAAVQAKFPWMPVVDKAEQAGQVSPDFRPRYPFWPQIVEALGLQLNSAALGTVTPEDALKTANEQIRKAIVAAGYPVK